MIIARSLSRMFGLPLFVLAHGNSVCTEASCAGVGADLYNADGGRACSSQRDC